MSSHTNEMTMVERAARAIYASTKMPIPWENIQPMVKQVLEEHARAAIEAMADPTETMITAMREADTFNYPESAWPAAIDAALQEKPE